jgi:hypothetical protein
MTSKLGFHTQSLDACKEIVKVCKPAVFKSLESNADKLWEIKGACPKTLFIGRAYIKPQVLNDPKNNALSMYNHILANTANCPYDALEGYCEWDDEAGYNLDAFKRRTEFEFELCRLLHLAGKKYVAGNFSTGTPPEEWMDIFEPVLKTCDYLGLHEYSAVAADIPDHSLFGGTYMKNGELRGWLTFKYRTLYAYLRDKGYRQPPLILTEYGMDRWRERGFMGIQYLDQLERVDAEFAKDSYLVGATIFQLGFTDPRWAPFDIMGEVSEGLRDYIKRVGPTYWTGVPAPQPTPIPVPTPTPQPTGSYANFPRPKDDNGIGIHLGTLVGDKFSRQLDNLKKMKTKWAVLCDADTDTLRNAGKVIRDMGIMPIYRPNKKVDDAVDWADTAKKVSDGVPSYIQIRGNEPSMASEWNHYPGTNWPATYAQLFIPAAHRVLSVGSIPCMQIDNLTGLIMLLHDFYDQTEFHNLIGKFAVLLHLYPEAHDGIKQCPPSCTQHEDDLLAVLKYAEVFDEKIDWIPPIIVSECGYPDKVNTKTDRPKWMVQLFDQFRTGVLANGDPLPDWLFTYCPWILEEMGLFKPWSWMDNIEQVPMLEAVASMPAFVRHAGVIPTPTPTPEPAPVVKCVECAKIKPFLDVIKNSVGAIEKEMEK